MKRVEEDLHIEDIEPEEIFFELPEKNVLFPRPIDAGFVLRICSPNPNAANPEA